MFLVIYQSSSTRTIEMLDTDTIDQRVKTKYWPCPVNSDLPDGDLDCWPEGLWIFMAQQVIPKLIPHSELD